MLVSIRFYSLFIKYNVVSVLTCGDFVLVLFYVPVNSINIVDVYSIVGVVRTRTKKVFLSSSRAETERNPWVVLTSALLTCCQGSEVKADLGQQVVTMVRSLYSTKHKLPTQVNSKPCSLTVYRHKYVRNNGGRPSWWCMLRRYCSTLQVSITPSMSPSKFFYLTSSFCPVT